MFVVNVERRIQLQHRRTLFNCELLGVSDCLARRKTNISQKQSCITDVTCRLLADKDGIWSSFCFTICFLLFGHVTR